MKTLSIIAIAVLMAAPVAVQAHSGRTNAQGCHNDRKNGGYHCHGGGRSAPAPVPRASGQSFANCAAARAAGAAPVRRGDPGYGRHLDRDNDGVGCE